MDRTKWKNYAEKNACSRRFWQKMKSWILMEVKTLIEIISARSLTLLTFAVGWALCGRPQPEHESMMPLVSLSLFKPIKTLSSVRKHLQKAFFLRNFFQWHPFNEMFIVNSKSHCCNDILTNVRITSHRCYQKIFKKNTSYFYVVRISI